MGCHVPSTPAQAHHIVIPWLCIVAFDTFIFAFTAARAYSLTSSRPSAPRGRSSHFRSLVRETSALDVAGVVWRDGALYYVIMVLLNVANVITFYVCEPLLKGALSTPSSAILALLCSRLMLNLHESSSAAPNSGRPLRTGTTDNESTTLGAAFTSQFELGAEIAMVSMPGEEDPSQYQGMLSSDSDSVQKGRRGGITESGDAEASWGARRGR
jgi:hypothetical protein